MNIDVNMKLSEGSLDEFTSVLSKWAGVYKIIELSDGVVALYEPEVSELAQVDQYTFEHTPKYKGYVRYIIYRVSKRRGRDSYWVSERGKGIYFYTVNETFNDFIKWFRDNEGLNISEKVLDYGKYGDVCT